MIMLKMKSLIALKNWKLKALINGLFNINNQWMNVWMWAFGVVLDVL